MTAKNNPAAKFVMQTKICFVFSLNTSWTQQFNVLWYEENSSFSCCVSSQSAFPFDRPHRMLCTWHTDLLAPCGQKDTMPCKCHSVALKSTFTFCCFNKDYKDLVHNQCVCHNQQILRQTQNIIMWCFCRWERKENQPNTCSTTTCNMLSSMLNWQSHLATVVIHVRRAGGSQVTVLWRNKVCVWWSRRMDAAKHMYSCPVIIIKIKHWQGDALSTIMADLLYIIPPITWLHIQ